MPLEVFKTGDKVSMYFAGEDWYEGIVLATKEAGSTVMVQFPDNSTTSWLAVRNIRIKKLESKSKVEEAPAKPQTKPPTKPTVKPAAKSPTTPTTLAAESPAKKGKARK